MPNPLLHLILAWIYCKELQTWLQLLGRVVFVAAARPHGANGLTIVFGPVLEAGSLSLSAFV